LNNSGYAFGIPNKSGFQALDGSRARSCSVSHHDCDGDG
jgi:hypothetical protein